MQKLLTILSCIFHKIRYNKIIEIEYYSYFIGEPARLKEEQIKVGIIKEGDPQMAVCCKTGYVILKDDTIKWLNPELMKTLLSDNEKLLNEFESKNLKPEEVYKMFDFLSRYNKTKK